jgi:hypothetical protein
MARSPDELRTSASLSHAQASLKAMKAMGRSAKELVVP